MTKTETSEASEAPRKKNAPDEFHLESESESALGDTAHVAQAAVSCLQYKGPLLSNFLGFKSCLRSVIQSPDARDSEIPS
jgi:hypothetical protein